jgi:hypothetical protein
MYDSRRGYGNNKIQQVCHLNSTGYQFRVHPAGFLVHRAHPFTDARKRLVEDLVSFRKHARAAAHKSPSAVGGQVINGVPVPGDFNASLFGHTKLLFESVKDQMDRKAFQPVVDNVTWHCKINLPWAKSGWMPSYQAAAAAAAAVTTSVEVGQK